MSNKLSHKNGAQTFFIELQDISKIKLNPDNPRIIKDEKFKQLVKSILEFPEMLKIRPIVVNDQMIVIGGNMRLKACKEAGLKEIPIIKASQLTPKQQKEFIIKDNIGFGEWDWETIANEWDAEQVTEWGLDIPDFKSENFEIEDMSLREKTMAHILLSFPIEKHQEINNIIKPVEFLDYCEIKRSSN